MSVISRLKQTGLLPAVLVGSRQSLQFLRNSAPDRPQVGICGRSMRGGGTETEGPGWSRPDAGQIDLRSERVW